VTEVICDIFRAKSWRWRRHGSPKLCCPTTSPQGIITQKTAFISRLIYCFSRRLQRLNQLAFLLTRRMQPEKGWHRVNQHYMNRLLYSKSTEEFTEIYLSNAKKNNTIQMLKLMTRSFGKNLWRIDFLNLNLHSLVDWFLGYLKTLFQLHSL